MPDATDEPQEQVRALTSRLTHDATDITAMWSYYVGNHPRPDATPETTDIYRRVMDQSMSNWLGLVVDAVAERLKVVGFRSEDETQVAAAETVWRRSRLGAVQELVHTDALVAGRGYALVEPQVNAPARVVAESPLQIIADYDEGNMWEPSRALKRWTAKVDGRKVTFATLYTPETIHRFQTTGTSMESAKWDPRADDIGQTVPNPFGAVPVVEFRNRPDSMGGCRSDIADVVSIQDRINSTIFHRVMAAMFTAFKQKWATGLELIEDEDGNTVQPFSSSAFRLWIAENPDVNFGEFAGDDLKGYISAVESDIQHMAAITRTPPHYLLGQSGAFPSGETLKSTETGLVAKVNARQQFFGEGWERVIGLATGTVDELEVVWKDPEARTEGELVDALTKMATLGVPMQVLWERWGATPSDVKRWVTMLRQESINGLGIDLDALAAEPDPTAATGADDASEVKARADAMGVLIRAGVDPVDAANRAGFDGVTFTGGRPVSLKFDDE